MQSALFEWHIDEVHKRFKGRFFFISFESSSVVFESMRHERKAFWICKSNEIPIIFLGARKNYGPNHLHVFVFWLEKYGICTLSPAQCRYLYPEVSEEEMDNDIFQGLGYEFISRPNL